MSNNNKYSVKSPLLSHIKQKNSIQSSDHHQQENLKQINETKDNILVKDKIITSHNGLLDAYYRMNPNRIEFNIAVVGIARCGKTATLCHITGRPMTDDYIETVGMQVLDLLWKVQNGDDVWNILLKFWDVGYGTARKHKYIAESWLTDVDGMLYVCSSVDPSSYTFIEQQIEQHQHTANTNRCAKIAVMTCNDRWDKREVSDADMNKLRDKGLEYFKISNTANIKVKDFRSDKEVREILNHLTLELVKKRKEKS